MNHNFILKNTFWYTLANYIPIMLSFILLPIYTRYLTPSDYGIIALIVALNSLLSVFISLQLPKSISKYFVDFKDNTSLSEFLSTILLSSLFISISTFLVLVVFYKEIIEIIFKSSDIVPFDLYLLSISSVLFTSLSSIFKSVLIFQQKGFHVFKLDFPITLLFTVIYFINIVVLDLKVYGVIIALLFQSLFQFLVYSLSTKGFFKIYFKFSYLHSPFFFAIGLIPHAIAGFAFITSDKIILEKYVNIIYLGIYSIGVKFINPIKTLIDNFNTSYSPAILSGFKSSYDSTVNDVFLLSSKLFFFTTVIILSAFMFSTDILYILTNDDFYSANYIIMILSLSFLFRLYYGFYGTAIIASGKSWIFSVITLICGTLNIILNVIFIPEYGIIVAAITTVVSYFLQFILSFIFSFFYYPIKIDFYRYIISLSIFGLLIFSFYKFPILYTEHGLFAFTKRLLIYVPLVMILFFLYRKYLNINKLIQSLLNKCSLLQK